MSTAVVTIFRNILSERLPELTSAQIDFRQTGLSEAGTENVWLPRDTP